MYLFKSLYTRMFSVKYFVSILFCVLLISACAEKPDSVAQLNGQTMGTTYLVKFLQPGQSDKVHDTAAIQKAVNKRLREINQSMSTYIEDSELSIINQSDAGVPLEISSELRKVISYAIDVYDKSLGKLDITVGPLVNKWGFGPDLKPENVPSQEDLRALSAYVGIDKFKLSGSTLIKLHKDVYIDLSTIAKGYGVDQVAELLESFGIQDYLVEIGGEMRVKGTKPNKSDWLIAVEKPVATERAIERIISIGDNAIATSGDYRNYYEEDGTRYSHLIDPKTKRPIQHNLVSVTVVAESSMHADAWATALIVLGPDQGMLVAQNNNIAALFITKENNDFVELTTEKFDQTVRIVN